MAKDRTWQGPSVPRISKKNAVRTGVATTAAQIAAKKGDVIVSNLAVYGAYKYSNSKHNPARAHTSTGKESKAFSKVHGNIQGRSPKIR